MIQCDFFKKEILERLCLVKHLGAEAKSRKEAESGIPAGFQPCLFCPVGLRLKEESMAKSTKTGTCTKCGKEGKIASGGLCWPCYDAKLGKKRRPAQTAGDAMEANESVAAELGKAEPTALPKAQMSFAPVVIVRQNGPALTLNIDEVPGLRNLLGQAAIEHLRTPEHQALWILREALKG